MIVAHRHTVAQQHGSTGREEWTAVDGMEEAGRSLSPHGQHWNHSTTLSLVVTSL